MKTTGTMVARLTSGNINRPPYLSVSAPTGIRPRAPTMTGTATSRATSDSEIDPRRPDARYTGPRGLSSAHAQKLIAKPTVATTNIRYGDRPGAVTACFRTSGTDPERVGI